MTTSIDLEPTPSLMKKNDGGTDEQAGEVIEPSYTPEEERGVLRKVDLVILPFMCFVFFLQYLDKQSLSYAGVFNLIEDLNLTSTQYSWCSSMFYVGQLVSEYPFIYLMSRFPLTKFVGATVILWGTVCLCLAAPQNFAGFATVRFLLGFCEGAVSPAFVTITSIWWRKDEHALRTAIWVTMNGLAQVFGCLLMYGIGKNTSLPLQPWRTMFLVCGSLTIAAGVGFFVLMPSGPKDAWFLNAREKEILSARMAEDREGGDKTSFSKDQFIETMMDPRSWFVFMFGVLVTMQSPVLTFAALMINKIGYSKLQTMLFTSPSGAIQVCFIWIGVALCKIFPNNRVLVVWLLSIPPFIGSILLLKLPSENRWGVIVSAWLASCCSSVMSILLSLTASNNKGNTKRAIVNTMFFIGYCAGCIGSPQLWTESPRYTKGVITAIVTWTLLYIVSGTYRFICTRENRRRDNNDQQVGVRGSTHVVFDKNGMPKSDLTDIEDTMFRYSF